MGAVETSVGIRRVTNGTSAGEINLPEAGAVNVFSGFGFLRATFHFQPFFVRFQFLCCHYRTVARGDALRVLWFG